MPLRSGDFAQANINLNFPNNWVNTVSITLQLLQCYYLIFYTNVVLVMGLEMDLGVGLALFRYLQAKHQYVWSMYAHTLYCTVRRTCMYAHSAALCDAQTLSPTT